VARHWVRAEAPELDRDVVYLVWTCLPHAAQEARSLPRSLATNLLTTNLTAGRGGPFTSSSRSRACARKGLERDRPGQLAKTRLTTNRP
jgi:hypothetical protein